MHTDLVEVLSPTVLKSVMKQVVSVLLHGHNWQGQKRHHMQSLLSEPMSVKSAAPQPQAWLTVELGRQLSLPGHLAALLPHGQELLS